MTDGSSTGLGSTDTSDPGDAPAGGFTIGITITPTATQISIVHDWLLSRADWQAARGLFDAWQRAKSEAGQG